jgi:hypothetical protein
MNAQGVTKGDEIQEVKRQRLPRVMKECNQTTISQNFMKDNQS